MTEFVLYAIESSDFAAGVLEALSFFVDKTGNEPTQAIVSSEDAKRLQDTDLPFEIIVGGLNTVAAIQPGHIGFMILGREAKRKKKRRRRLVK